MASKYVCIGLSLILLLLGTVVADNWPMSGFDVQGTGKKTDATTPYDLSAYNIGDTVWANNIVDCVVYSPPIVSQGIVYSPFSNGVDLGIMALNLTDGTQLWNYSLSHSNKCVDISPCMVGDYVCSMIRTNTHQFVCVNKTDGSLLVDYTSPYAGWYYGDMICDSNTVFGSLGDGSSLYVAAVDLSTSTEVWNYTISVVTSDGWWAALDPASGVEVISSADSGALYILDKDTGALLWDYPTGKKITQPAIYAGDIWVAAAADLWTPVASDPNMYRCSLTTHLCLNYTVNDGSGPVVIDNGPTFVNYQGQVTAFFIASGSGNLYLGHIQSDGTSGLTTIGVDSDKLYLARISSVGDELLIPIRDATLIYNATTQTQIASAAGSKGVGLYVGDMSPIVVDGFGVVNEQDNGAFNPGQITAFKAYGPGIPQEEPLPTTTTLPPTTTLSSGGSGGWASAHQPIPFTGAAVSEQGPAPLAILGGGGGTGALDLLKQPLFEIPKLNNRGTFTVNYGIALIGLAVLGFGITVAASMTPKRRR